MGYKPVGVDENSMFPARVLNALKNLFALKTDVEPVNLSASTKANLNNLYVSKSDFIEAVQDIVGNMIVVSGGSGAYDDNAGKFTITITGSSTTTPTTPSSSSYLLTQNSDYLITQSGNRIIT